MQQVIRNSSSSGVLINPSFQSTVVADSFTDHYVSQSLLLLEEIRQAWADEQKSKKVGIRQSCFDYFFFFKKFILKNMFFHTSKIFSVTLASPFSSCRMCKVSLGHVMLIGYDT